MSFESAKDYEILVRFESLSIILNFNLHSEQTRARELMKGCLTFFLECTMAFSFREEVLGLVYGYEVLSKNAVIA